MNNFDFANQRLDAAFRTLCAKLYFKAESQQLDRIIEAFAKRYYECNPTTLLHCFDVVYAVAYSLLLLNTDLHVVNDWTNKMTRSSFIKNTMETIQSLVFPHLADTSFSQQRKRRVSLVSHQSIDSSSYHLKRNDSTPSTISYLNDETLLTITANAVAPSLPQAICLKSLMPLNQTYPARAPVFPLMVSLELKRHGLQMLKVY